MPKNKTYDDLRNIRRWIVFERGLELYNERHSDTMSKNHVSILYCLRHHQRVGKLVNMKKLMWWLGIMKKDKSQTRVTEYIRKLQSSGYVSRAGRSYFITPSGNTALQDLERIVKQQRVDR